MFRRSSMQRLLFQITIFLAVSAIFYFNSSRASHLFQKILPEGPSTCRTALRFDCGGCIPEAVSKDSLRTAEMSPNWSFNPQTDGRNYGLTSVQCDVAFPGLFSEIGHSARHWQTSHITLKDLEREVWPKATIRAMIYDEELYILGYTRPTVRASRHLATFHSIHRAMLTSPEPIPNIEFVVSVDDFAESSDDLIWSYTRKAGHNNTWVMPDFGFWSWPESESMMGSWTQVRRRVEEAENNIGSFAQKIPKAFWRGNVAMAKRLRQDLISRTKDKPWADVMGITWGSDGADANMVPIEDHCKYMFVIHTEGNSYSGRLKYIQTCRSVIFAHDMQWIQPFEYLMVPDGPKQNYVCVERDFSDLEQKIEYYLEHKEEAERIASNSVETFRNRYLTPAAEACYWRKLIQGWSEVSFKPAFYDNSGPERRWRGTPFENFALKRHQAFLDEENG